MANNKPSLLDVTKWMRNSNFMSFGFWFGSNNAQCYVVESNSKNNGLANMGIFDWCAIKEMNISFVSILSSIQEHTINMVHHQLHRNNIIWIKYIWNNNNEQLSIAIIHFNNILIGVDLIDDDHTNETCLVQTWNINHQINRLTTKQFVYFCVVLSIEQNFTSK